jgi:CheY-like chemotaxis protein
MIGVLNQAEHARGRAVRLCKPGVLVVDDMALILTLLKFELESRGFAVWLAVDGDDALDLYRRHGSNIDLVLLDVQMPGMDGPHTLEALQRLNPDVVACFMAESVGSYTEEDLLGRGAAWIFAKPFRPGEVADLLQRVASTSDSPPFVCDKKGRSEGGGQEEDEASSVPTGY